MALPAAFQKVAEKKGWAVGPDGVHIELEHGRKQVVSFHEFQHDGETMVRAYSTVGSAEALTPTRLESALGLNFSMPFGALAVHGGRLVMTDTFLLKDADDAEIESSILYVAKTADRYERLVYNTDSN